MGYGYNLIMVWVRTRFRVMDRVRLELWLKQFVMERYRFETLREYY